MTKYRDKHLKDKEDKNLTDNSADRAEAFKKENVITLNETKSKKINQEIESSDFLKKYKIQKNSPRPRIDYKNPSSFCFYGSAENYYKDSFERIYNNYPYDGSRMERINWALSSSMLDLAVLDHAYPKTTGHVNFSAHGWGTRIASSGLYGKSNNLEYIEFNGGPHKDSIYNESKRLENNLKIDGTYGNTVEFWMNKVSFVGTNSQKEVIIDVYTPGVSSGSLGYGRFLIESTSSSSPFVFSYISGNTGFVNQRIGSTLTGPSIADAKWHHYALSVGNVSGSLQAQLFVDGTLSETITKSETVSAVTSHHAATIGAMATTSLSLGGLGYGKLSASLDDFRYWKERRSIKQIGTYYDKPVYGGTVEDTSNPTLGVYYKFNEGITQNNDYDSVVLDYSGRINNGKFIGYNAHSRGTDSAIDESLSTTNNEKKDPVIYEIHPAVLSSQSELEVLGRGYDANNDHSIAKNLPNWASEEARSTNSLEGETHFGFLTRLIAKVFDDMHLYTKNLPQLRRMNQNDFLEASGALSPQNNEGFGPSGYYDENVLGISDMSAMAENSVNMLGLHGHLPPLLENAEIQEDLYSFKEDAKTFESDIHQIKNKILKNVHTNLTHIYKTKGTEESFRNLIRCFGVDTDLVNIHVYGHNEERLIENSKDFISQKKKSVSFEGLNNNATIFAAASNSDESHYLRSSGVTPWTVEGSFLFPKMKSDLNYNLSASLFGAHETETSKLKLAANDRFSFQVSSQKLNNHENIARFMITSSAGLFSSITTDYFSNVYDNTKWDLAVRFKKDRDFTYRSNTGPENYKVEFIGNQYNLDVLENSFHLSSSVSKQNYDSLSAANKSFFIGAHRVDFTGSVLLASDSRNIHLNVWNDNISDEDIMNHAINSENVGRTDSQFISDHDTGTNRKTSNTLALRWQYDNLTSSRSDGTMPVFDASSGSINDVTNYGNVVGYKYPASSIGLIDTGSAIVQEYFATPQYVQVDNALGKDNVTIKTREIDKFKSDSRPLRRVYSFEKSMYQVISREIVNFMSGIVSLNNLIGEPVNKYRTKYKLLEAIKERFFSKVENEIDLDKFVEYYRWIDESLGQMLHQIQPLSSQANVGLKNVVESHALERNKYQHAFPVVEDKGTDKIPVATLLGVNESLYDWEYGHAPVPSNTLATAATATLRFPDGSNSSPLLSKTVTIKNTENTTKVFFLTTDSGLGTTGATDGSGRIITQLNGISGSDGFAQELATAVLSVSGFRIDANTSADTITFTQDVTGLAGNNAISTTIHSLYAIVSGFAGGTDASNSSSEDDNCLWQRERKERPSGQKREDLRVASTTDVSGSTYVLRRLAKPYRYSVDRQRMLSNGSNRESNKNKDLYKVINSGKEVTINKSDIFEFRKCNDVIDPNASKIYQAKTDTTGTNGYLDADSDMILPFTLYSSSVGVDFDEFKPGLQITNNHDRPQSLQSPFVASVAGAQPHRNVKVGTTAASRPEAYSLSSSSGDKLILKSPSNKPKSMISRGPSTAYNVQNIKHTTSSATLGNYTYDYDIVMTSGRSLNNNYFIDTEGRWLTGTIFTNSTSISGAVEYPSPQRGRTEHVFVNRFSSPGGPETAAVIGRDLSSGEYSVYNTLNYRNTMIRTATDVLSGIPSLKYGLRSGSATQGSNHKTYRNPLRLTRTTEDDNLENSFKYDNLFVQHAIPQNDYGYSWITASAFDNVYEYLNRNGNFGHSHNMSAFGKVSKYSLPPSQLLFVTGSDRLLTLDFAGMSNVVQSHLTTSANTIGHSDSVELNDLILNRQGPYGWPSWKQLRGQQHPIALAHRRENNVSILFRDGEPNVSSLMNYEHSSNPSRAIILDTSSETKSRMVKNYKDIFATNKFKPITLTKHPTLGGIDNNLITKLEIVSLVKGTLTQELQKYLWQGDQFAYENFSRESSEDELYAFDRILGGTLIDIDGVRRLSTSPVSITITYQNDLTSHANREIIKDLGIEEITPHGFDNILEAWLNTPTRNPSLNEMNYSEVIYPREENTFLKVSRKRTRFDFFGWNSNRNSRQLILSGNIDYGSSVNHLIGDKYFKLFPSSSVRNEKDEVRSFAASVDKIDTTSFSLGALGHNIVASTWPLDSRSEITRLPVDITSSYFVNADSFLANRDQGRRGEGSLQNDYSIFALGFNGLNGVPPAVPTYSRRVPQKHNTRVLLAGEAKWTAADSLIGPFYDSYEDYIDEIRRVGQDHSIVPEFRISDFVEDSLSKHQGDLTKAVGDNFLSLTGAIYHSSSGDLQVGTQFFKSYSNSDFLKYFQVVSEKVSDPDQSFDRFMSPTRMTLRCQAAMKFLPYKGFYPAERLVQLGDIFSRNYLKESSYNRKLLSSGPFSSDSDYIREGLLSKRINASKYHAMKPIFMPGVLNNSIKSGLAVDYPIFSTDYSEVESNISGFVTASIRFHEQAGIPIAAGITGSIINNTEGVGVPRLNGTISKRVTFDDVLYLDTLFGESIYDNEPHPSASLVYGNSHFSRIIERPSRFGTLNVKKTKEQLAVDFSTNKAASIGALSPYISAVNNFAAETVNFFLEDQKLQTIISEPIKMYADKDQEYKMRVYVENKDTVMYDRHSSFGPAVDEGHVHMAGFSTAVAGVPGAAASLVLGPFNNPNTYTYNSDNSILPGFTIADTLGNKGHVHYYDRSNFTQLSSSAHGSIVLTASAAKWGSGQITSDSPSLFPRIQLVDETSTGATIRYYDPNFYGTTLGTYASFDITLDFAHTVQPEDHSIHPTPWHATYDDVSLVPDRVGSNGYRINYESSVWNSIVTAMPRYNFTVISGSGFSNTTAGLRVYDGLLFTGSIIACKIAASSSMVWGAGVPGQNDNEGNGQTFQATSVSNCAYFTLSASTDNSLGLNHKFVFYRSSKIASTSGYSRTTFINLDAHTTREAVRGAIYAGVVGSSINKHVAMHFEALNDTGEFSFISRTGSYFENQSNFDLTWYDPGAYGFVSSGNTAGVFGEFSGSISSALTFMRFDAGHALDSSDYQTFSSVVSIQSAGKILPVTASITGGQLETTLSNRSLFSESPALQICNLTSDYNPASAASYTRAGGQYAINMSSSLASVYSQGGEQSVSSSVCNSNVLGGRIALAVAQTGARTTKANEESITFANGFENLSMIFGGIATSFAGGTDTVHTTPTDTSAIKYVSVATTSPDKQGGFTYRGANTVVSQSISRLSEFGLKFNYETIDSDTSTSHLKIIVQTMGTGSQSACSIASTNLAYNTSSPSGAKVFINTSVAFTGAAETTSYSGFPTNSGNKSYVQLNQETSALAVVSGTLAAINYLSGNFDLQVTPSYGGGNSANTLVLTQGSTGSAGNTSLTTPTSSASSAFSNVISVSSETFAGGVDASVQQVLEKNDKLQSGSHGYKPFVPPYLDKNSDPYVELTFSPTETREYNAREIVDNLTASYVNFKEPPSNAGSLTNINHNYNHAMCLSASIDFKKVVRLERDKYIYGSQVIQGISSNRIAESNEYSNFGYRWVIQPFWETPIHDFSKAAATTIDLSNNSEVSIAGSPWKTREWNSYYTSSGGSASPYMTSSTGMWHQHGTRIGNGTKGYYLRVEDSGDNGLASAVGIATGYINSRKDSKANRRLGEVAKKKTIKESVVAVPYYTNKDCTTKFFDMNKEHLESARSANLSLHQKHANIINSIPLNESAQISKALESYSKESSLNGTNPVSNIAYQLRMMDRYVVPPQFDFTNNEDQTPLVMYFFEFTAELNSDDLSNIWQNLYPSSSVSTGSPRYSDLDTGPSSQDVTYISHVLDSKLIQSLRNDDSNYSNYQNPGEMLENEVRWLVFKCKYRSESNYENVRRNSIDPTYRFGSESIQEDSAKQGYTGDTSFNWPYDYFSFVELIKVENKVDFYSTSKKGGRFSSTRPEDASASTAASTLPSQNASGARNFNRSQPANILSQVRQSAPTVSSMATSINANLASPEAIVSNITAIPGFSMGRIPPINTTRNLRGGY